MAKPIREELRRKLMNGWDGFEGEEPSGSEAFALASKFETREDFEKFLNDDRVIDYNGWTRCGICRSLFDPAKFQVCPVCVAPESEPGFSPTRDSADFRGTPFVPSPVENTEQAVARFNTRLTCVKCGSIYIGEYCVRCYRDKIDSERAEIIGALEQGEPEKKPDFSKPKRAIDLGM